MKHWLAAVAIVHAIAWLSMAWAQPNPFLYRFGVSAWGATIIWLAVPMLARRKEF
jgi:hypothetical protein